MEQIDIKKGASSSCVRKLIHLMVKEEEEEEEEEENAIFGTSRFCM